MLQCAMRRSRASKSASWNSFTVRTGQPAAATTVAPGDTSDGKLSATCLPSCTLLTTSLVLRITKLAVLFSTIVARRHARNESPTGSDRLTVIVTSSPSSSPLPWMHATSRATFAVTRLGAR